MTDEFTLSDSRQSSTWPFIAIMIGAVGAGALALLLQPGDLWPARLMSLAVWMLSVFSLLPRGFTQILFHSQHYRKYAQAA